MMKNNAKRLIAFLLVLVTIIGVFPIANVVAFAANSGSKKPAKTFEEERGYVPYSELPQMSDDFHAGIYVDGELVYQEGTQKNKLDIIKYALDNFAPSTLDADGLRMSEEAIAGLKEVRVVFNKDFCGELVGLNNIYGKKLYIDLNGHIVCPTTYGYAYEYKKYEGKTSGGGKVYTYISVDNRVIGVRKGYLGIMDSNPYTVHVGKIVDNGSSGRWVHSSDGNVPIKGGVFSGTYNGNSGITLKKGAYTFSGIHMISSTLEMMGGTIAGFDTIGSTVYAYQSSVILNNESSIKYNKSYNSIVRLQLNTNKLVMSDKACISHNKSDLHIVLGNTCAISGGTISYNEAGQRGGGIVIAYSNTATIDGVLIEHNKTAKDGGGIANAGKNTTVKNCIIRYNYSNDRGGGISSEEHTLAVENTSVVNNASKEHGGGILVKPDSFVSISGLMIVKDNYKASYDKFLAKSSTDNSNLYLQGNNDLIVSSLELGSEVWIRTGKPAKDHSGKDKTLTKGGHENRTGVSPAFFYADNTEYYVDLILDSSHKNYRSLCLMKGTRPAYKDVKVLDNYSPVELAEYYTTKTGETYPLYKGYFEFNLMSTSAYYSASPFFYSDGYFAEDPKYYNPHLATMSINMAVAAFGRSTSYVGNNSYANHFANVKQLMSDIGCDDKDFYANKGYQNQPEFYGENNDILSTIGVAISQKKITVGKEDYTLVPVAIRGGSYEIEWASNVTIGNSGEAKGFADAADQVYNEIKNYLKSHGLEDAANNGKVKFWVVGYSRAGATTNLTSKRLVDNYGKQGNQVYGYSFEAPMGGVESAKLSTSYTDYGKYLTIHNTVNENDFVTLVAPSEMGFLRYGVDHLVGSDYNNGNPVTQNKDSQYWQQRQKMVDQLAAINPYYVFDDYWTAADLNIYFGVAGWKPITEPEKVNNEDYQSMYKALRAFFLRIQKYGLNVSQEDYRETYSTTAILENVRKGKNNGKDVTDKSYYFGNSDYSIQKAVQELMKLMYTLPSETISKIMDMAVTSMFGKMDDWMFGKLTQIVFLDNYLREWTMVGKTSNADDVDRLLHLLLNPYNGKSIWDLLTHDQAVALAKSLPVVLYFAFDFMSRDYHQLGSTYCTGSFVHNMDSIIANHYQEISVAWVRSYDNYYDNELQAYRIDTSSVYATKPKSSYSSSNNTLTLSAQPGSSIFYSVNGGKTWELYTEPVTFQNTPEAIKTFSIVRGTKSPNRDVNMNQWSGSLLGNGNVWAVIIGSAAIVAGAVITIEVTRKKRRANSES